MSELSSALLFLTFVYFSGTSQLSSGDASDSICPKGWGMMGRDGMARFDGDGSYQKLIANVYGMNKTNMGTTQNYKEYSTQKRIDELIVQYIFSFMRTGYVGWNSGENTGRQEYGSYWESRVYLDGIVAFSLRYYPTSLYPQNTGYKGYGFSLRCVAKYSSILTFSLFCAIMVSYLNNLEGEPSWK